MTTVNNTAPEVLLNEVTKQFEAWRTTRDKRTTIPKELWLKVLPLEKHYSLGNIAIALKLSSLRLKKGLLFAKSGASSITLQECSTRSFFNLPSSQTITLTFSCKKGGTATFTGLNSHDFTAALSTLL